MSIIAIIPARGGSTRIPRKNAKLFHGEPIMSYSIQRAKASGLFDRIVVSTDDIEMSLIAEHYGAEVWMRDPAFGLDCVGTQAVTRECLLGIKADDCDYVCCIYATAPLMSVGDLMEGYGLLHRYGSIDYVMSVGYPPLQDAAQFYWGMACNFIDDVPLISERTRFIRIAPNRVCDINTPEDWDKAVEMYGKLR